MPFFYIDIIVHYIKHMLLFHSRKWTYKQISVLFLTLRKGRNEDFLLSPLTACKLLSFSLSFLTDLCLSHTHLTHCHICYSNTYRNVTENERSCGFLLFCFVHKSNSSSFSVSSSPEFQRTAPITLGLLNWP